MMRTFARLALATGLSALVALSAHARQDGKFYKAPETTLDYWNAIKIERDLGQPELAAKLLRQLLLKNPTNEQLLQIVDKEKGGSIALARLVAVVRWSEDDKINDQARKDAETLLTKAQDAIRKRATDEVYIRRLIGMLKGDREEQGFASRELTRLRETTVPYLLDEIARDKDPASRLAMRRTLERLGPEAAGPLVAALDGYPKNPEVKLEVLDLLRNKHATQSARIVPFLWFPSSNPDEDSAVRVKARQLLADFQDLPVSRLQPAKVALTREAERYLNRAVKLVEPVIVWRWEGGRVVQGLPGGGLGTAARTELHYGTKFAQEALKLDPEYTPAQSVLLSLLLDRSPTPLPASLSETVNKAELPLLLTVLDRALKEERPGVLLPVIRAIGLRAEIRAKRPLNSGESGLVRALSYPDPRVQLAAVEALLAIPGTPSPAIAKRILEILARALSPAAAYVPGIKVLVALGDQDWRARVVDALRGMDLVPVEARNGRDAMRRLKEDASIQAMVTESTLPNPGLAHFLAQVKADRGLKKLPILLAAVPETREARAASIRFGELDRQRKALLDAGVPFLLAVKQVDQDHAERLQELIVGKGIGPKGAALLKRALDAYARRIEESKTANKSQSGRLEAMELLNRDLNRMIVMPSLALEVGIRDIETYLERHEKERAEIVKSFPNNKFFLKRLEKLQEGVSEQADRYDREALHRENALARFVTRYPAVSVVAASALADSGKVVPALSVALRTAALPPAAVVAGDAETAIRILRNLARGTPPGYDIAPAGKAVLAALREGRLSEKGQMYAIEAAEVLSGSENPQAEFATIILADGRLLPVRVAAAEALIRHVQKAGNVVPTALKARLHELTEQPKLPVELKKQLELFVGVLGNGSSGSRLRDYKPAPMAPVILPPKEAPKEKPKKEAEPEKD